MIPLVCVLRKYNIAIPMMYGTTYWVYMGWNLQSIYPSAGSTMYTLGAQVAGHRGLRAGPYNTHIIIRVAFWKARRRPAILRA